MAKRNLVLIVIILLFIFSFLLFKLLDFLAVSETRDFNSIAEEWKKAEEQFHDTQYKEKLDLEKR